MKILQVIHDFLPNHQAGSELYCYHLSKTLQRMGHDVHLCFTEIDHTRDNYSTREGEYDDLPFTEIVNNHGYASFAETYSNPQIENIFANLLDDMQPDIVHYHHLLGLSFGCVRLCKERGIPVVFTLHDYWLTCPRGGGQRFRGIGKVCHDVDTSLCAECISRYSFPARTGQRIVKRLLNRIDARHENTLIPMMMRGTINTPKRDFVSQGICAIQGDARPSVFAHPPSSITIQTKIPNDASLVFSYSMDAVTYNKQGDGVRFEIVCNDDVVFDEILQPKQNSSDQGWHQASVDLSAYANQKTKLTWKTSAYPNGEIDFTTACWAEPRIVHANGESYHPSNGLGMMAWMEKVLSSMQKHGLQKQVDHRAQAALDIMNLVNLFIAPSQFLRGKLIEYGLPPERIVFSDYGIADLEEATEPRHTELPLRFTFVGTVVEHKGLHVLIEAFNKLPADAAVLNVYGALNEFQGYAANVKNMIAHPGIHLRGRAENKDIAGILAQTDALIVPSIWFENSPITIHEAFLARVPVITSRFGGMADLVKDGENGLLFEMGNADNLYRCLKELIDHPQRVNELRPKPESVKSLQADGAWMIEQYHHLLKQKQTVQ